MAPDTPPRHVACIMDGNGRWAQQRGLERTHGHMAAHAALDAIMDGVLAAKVEWLTLFAFSAENWSRPQEEVSFLVRFLTQHVISREAQRLRKRGVRLRVLGGEDPRIPAEVTDKLREVEELTRDNSTLQLSLAFNYGGRQDLCETARSLAAQKVPAEEITAETFAQHMQLPELPDVDLLLRTGGEHRLSNFLLWHCAYAELVFLDVLWPDFRITHFRHALELYQQRQRRFGAVDPPEGADAAAAAASASGFAGSAFEPESESVETAASLPLNDHPSPPGPPSPPTRGLSALPDLSVLTDLSALPGRSALPDPSVLLNLPTAIASHLGATLWDGLRETARFTLNQLTEESTQAGPPNLP
ncbi:polyprenyl diphosphate synthase [Streptomyces iconiensis]|uniref:Isoprenyl transferase n=1 Tax=Streptomyces iconiensis TaxID=1384038 RepID=A0ABT7A2F7_9ACTN|nr:polyprenyl diphosphate synthase [Streptomyces iconiensis]MDJ1134803.1 polyprenyl diphosphate synthase [Streptomyces iconiensis]